MAHFSAIYQQATQGADAGPTHVRITNTEFLFYSSLILLLIGLTGWLIVQLIHKERDEKKAMSDGIATFNQRLEAVAAMMTSAAIDFERAASAIKDWTSSNFVHRPEHESAIQSIREDMALFRTDINVHAERFQRELDLHIRYCPKSTVDNSHRGPL